MKYRVGRKQKRAIINEDGVEVALFSKGQEELAEKVCKKLNEEKTTDEVIGEWNTAVFLTFIIMFGFGVIIKVLGYV